MRFFLHGALSAEKETTWSRFGELKSVEDCPQFDELVIILTPRIATREAGKAIPRSSPKAESPMPQDFAAALAKAGGARGFWDGFTDSQRRDYLDWITSAKQDATRARRIATAAEWIGDGKRRNRWYEGC